jgi:hypothetical protein
VYNNYLSAMFVTVVSDKSGDYAILKNVYGGFENKFVFPRVFQQSEFDSVD